MTVPERERVDQGNSRARPEIPPIAKRRARGVIQRRVLADREPSPFRHEWGTLAVLGSTTKRKPTGLTTLVAGIPSVVRDFWPCPTRDPQMDNQ